MRRGEEFSAPKVREHRLCSAEDWESWRVNPVTQLVMGIFEQAADAQREAWIARSWEHGKAEEGALIEFRSRSDAYRALNEMTYSAFVKRLEAMEGNVERR